jgi:hypothetical protein
MGVLDFIMTDTNFLVYAYTRSKNSRFGGKGTFYYIGKGRPNRPYSCGEKDRNIKCPRDRVNNILILHSNLDEETALLYEKLLIQLYGRIDTTEFGVLRNLTDGGEGFAGVIFTDDHKKKIAKALSKPRNWYHPDYGKILQKSVSELVNMFPNQKLSRSALRQVFLGNRFHHKGWKLPENKNVNKKAKADLHDWYHPQYGEIFQKSYSDLIRMFPEQKLNRHGLRQVSLGNHSHRNGWKLLKNKDKPNKQENNILRDWYHEIYGKVLQISATDLAKKYPDQKLHQGALSQVALSRYSQHKGWRILK